MKLVRDRSEFDFKTVGSVSLAPNAGGSIELRVEADGWIIGQTLQATRTGRFRSFLRDSRGTSYIRAFPQTNPAAGPQFVGVEDASLFGTAQLPFRFTTPLVIAPNTSIFFDLMDFSGLANDVQITLSGRKWRNQPGEPPMGQVFVEDKTETITLPGGKSINIPRKEKRKRDRRDNWYMYAVDAPLLAGEDREFPILTDADADFFATNLRAFSTKAGLSFAAMMSDPREKWSLQFVNRDNGFGNAAYPVPVVPAKWIKGQESMTARVRDLAGGAGTNDIQIAIEGIKRYGA
jgi:hypothetical protein